MNDISSFMHEIKNPLGNIYSLCDLINLEDDIKLIKELTLVLKQSIEQVISLEKEYNEYRKTYKSTVKPTCFLIGELINDIIKEYKSAIEKKEIKTIINIDEKASKKDVYTDKTKLKQVLINIISNAIKYNKEGGSIEIDIYTYKESTYISVKDTGIGIKKKDLDKIGSPFYRCKEIEAEGSGLGMSLIKKICSKMNWDLSIESIYNEGTVLLLII
jgi:signal transduction histidine kinase